MRVFISWSGERSHIVAQALKEWIPDVLQEVQTWMSSDIEAGRRWGNDIDAQLSATDFGVVCLTQENLRAPWILFEAGALAKRVEYDARLVPYLIDDMRPGNIEPPLGLFQAQRADASGTRQLIRSINSTLATPLDSERLDRVFDNSWLRLESSLREVPAPENISSVERPQEEILLEVLDTVRNMAKSVDQIAPSAMNISTETDYHAYRTWLLKRRDQDLEMIKWADIMASLNDWHTLPPVEEEPEGEYPKGQ